ncbi:MAG TPA: response regulator transcription factor [Bacteroidales bacterium]|nr:response regulator transcription factor [Bacteroidales bacterium]
MGIKVAVYEDNFALRESLTFLIRGTNDLELTGAWGNCVSIIEHCRLNKPDVILMDIDMPDVDGIQGTQMVKATFPEIEILIFTVFNDRDKLLAALCAGASGYILKKSSAIEIIAAIIELYNGGSPMSGEIARKVLGFFTNNHAKPQDPYDLTKREYEILHCLVKGQSYKMVADQCSISIGTVRSHINAIYKKLHVNSKSEVVVKAISEKLVIK